MAGTAAIAKEWWKESVVYQIYPSSFKDSNGDGLGDIPGIISKVDYLASLGIDAVWLSPFFKSPQVDMGYDISDYREVHPPYGTVADVEKLIAELKKHNIKLLMDLVVNHTSNQHPWFLESKSSKTNPKRDWYIWHKGKTGQNGESMPPNNWESLFKGSAWEYDAGTDEWYYHIFAIEQPDLNWENPEVRAAIDADIHFWLSKGVGGIRMDAINLISKPTDLSDAPVTQPGYHQSCFELVKNRPKVHEWLRELKANVLDQYPGLLTVGECGGTNDIKDVKNYIMPERKELDIIFQFELMEVDSGPMGVFSGRDWHLSDIKSVTDKWQNILRPAWNTFHLENHDSGRSINRFGRAASPEFFPAVSKLLAFFTMTLGGTIFLHQGQEIGAVNLTADIPLAEYKDISTHRDVNKTLAARIKAAGHDNPDMSDVMREVLLKARDHGRVPIAWDGSSPGAGFTTAAKPWMTLSPDFAVNNVAAQEAQGPGSVLNTWRDLIRLRRENVDELVYGGFELVDEKHEHVFAYLRRGASGRTLLVALNWCDMPVEWVLVGVQGAEARKAIKTVGKVSDDLEKGTAKMEPYACACWEVKRGEKL